MRKMALLVIVLLVFCGGCRLLADYPYTSLVKNDSTKSEDTLADIGINDTPVLPDTPLLPDTLVPDILLLDTLPDTLKPDILKPDTLVPDTLKPDTRNLCTGIECSHGTCDPKTGKCMCDTGFAGIGCDKCAYAYGPYPTCTALLPTVAIKINCNSPCNKFGTTTVDIKFTNAITFRTQLDCVSGTCMGNPPVKGTVTPSSGNLPTTTTNTITKHTIQWTFGGSGSTDLRIRVFVTGPGGTKEDNKSIALSP